MPSIAQKERMWHPHIEAMPRGELRELQDQRLRAQIAYVYERSSLYREKMKASGVEPGDIKSVEDLPKLPLTAKDELRQSQDVSPPFGRHVCASQDEVVWLPSTSGTTGIPLLLPRTQSDLETWTELNARGFTVMGVGRGDIHLNIVPYHWIFGGLAVHLGGMRAGITMINAGTGNTAKQVWALNYMAPTSIHATPSYLVHLAGKVHENGTLDKVKLRTVTGGGEIGIAGIEAKRRMRERYPSAKSVLDAGGVTDVGTMIWAECPEESGGHLFEDSVIVEILDPDTGAPVPPGTVGEVVYTDIVSKGAPLIRYRVGDLTYVDEYRCSCGRTLARMPEGVLGRADDMVTVRGGNLYPSTLDEIIKGFDELSGNYQAIIDRPGALDEITIRVETRSEIAPAARAGLAERLGERLKIGLGSKARIEVLKPRSLPEFAVKAKRIIDKRKGETEEDAVRKAREQQG